MTDSSDDYDGYCATMEWSYDTFYEKKYEFLKSIKAKIAILQKEQKRRELYPQSIPDDFEWETKNGESIFIEKLSDSHLKNILKMLKKSLKKNENKEFEEIKPYKIW